MKYVAAQAVFSAFIVLAFITGFCAEEGTALRSVFLIHNSWHAALAIRVSDIGRTALPEARDFPGAEYLEISWGDADYFPAPHSGFFDALKAAFWSRGSVIHVVGFSGSIDKTYPGAEILEIRLDENGFGRMLTFISDDFARPGPGSPAHAASGLFPNSRFYLAKSSFSALRTCNTWVAEALQAAGLPLNTRFVITSAALAKEVKPFAARKSTNPIAKDLSNRQAGVDDQGALPRDCCGATRFGAKLPTKFASAAAGASQPTRAIAGTNSSRNSGTTRAATAERARTAATRAQTSGIATLVTSAGPRFSRPEIR